MYEIAMMGSLSAVAALILVWKINIYWFCKYHWQTDVAFGSLVTYLFFGTFSGIAAAGVAGVVFSILLFVSKLLVE